MDEENDNETSKIIKQHNMTLKLLKDLKKKRNKLVDDEERLRNQQDKFNRELIQINSDIESSKEGIELLLNENNTSKSHMHIGADVISQKCENIVNSFFNANNKSLMYKIEYGSVQLEGKLEPEEDYTFYQLKQTMKRQFDKSENEFYFADERGYIYLDGLSVKKCLFPLKKVNIRGYLPIAIVLDKKSKLDNFNNEITKLKNKVEDDYARDSKAKITWKDKLKELIRKNAFIVFHLLIFIMFIIFWCKSCLFFRNTIDYGIIVKSILKESDIYVKNVDVKYNFI